MNVRFITSGKNLGFLAFNGLIQDTDAEFCALLNQDILLDEKFVEEALIFFHTHPEAGSLNPRVLRLIDGKKTSTIDSFGITFEKNLQAKNIGEGLNATEFFDKDLLEIFGASGACPIYRRKALEDAATFTKGKEYIDADFFMYKDDVDLSFRIRLLGWQSFFSKKVLTYHARSARSEGPRANWYETFKNRRQRSALINFYSYRNQLLFLIKDVPFGILLRYLPFVLFYEMKKIVYLLIFEPETLKALKDVFLLMPAMLRKRRQILRKRVTGNKQLRTKMFL